jgi:hypothetical protein
MPYIYSLRYVVFGEAKIEDLAQHAQITDVENLKPPSSIIRDVRRMAPQEEESDDEEVNGIMGSAYSNN